MSDITVDPVVADQILNGFTLNGGDMGARPRKQDGLLLRGFENYRPGQSLEFTIQPTGNGDDTVTAPYRIEAKVATALRLNHVTSIDDALAQHAGFASRKDLLSDYYGWDWDDPATFGIRLRAQEPVTLLLFKNVQKKDLLQVAHKNEEQAAPPTPVIRLPGQKPAA